MTKNDRTLGYKRKKQKIGQDLFNTNSKGGTSYR